MKYRNFEKHVSEALRQDEMSLDVNQLIQDIHGKNKDRRRIFFIWFFGLGLFFSAGYLSIDKFTAGDTYEIKPIKKLNFSTPEATVMDDENKQLEHNQKSESNLGQKQATKNLNKILKIQNKKVIINDAPKHVYAKLTDSYNGEKTVLESVLEATNIRNDIEVVPINSISGFLDKPGISGIIKDKITCPTFSNKQRFYIEVIPEIGAFLPLKQLENKLNEPNNVFGLRNQNEKTLEGLNAGLYVQFRKQKLPFYLKTGVSYSQLTEKMNLDYSYIRKDTTQGIISITVSQTGDTITTIYGDIITDNRISGKKVMHHTISMVDLPLSLGMEKNFGTWFAAVEAGLMINLSMRAKGSILATDTSFVELDRSASGYFRPSLDLSYFGGLIIGKDFQNIGRCYLSVRARHLPNYFSSETNPIRQSYNFVGVNLGYVFSF